MITYPNQKIIHINKKKYKGGFLQVGNDEWMKACDTLTYNAFKVYLYLAGNADGFDLALSRKALQNDIAMHDNTYSKVVKELIEKNYLVHKQGNIYDFYTSPHSNVEIKTKQDKTNVSSDMSPHSNVVYTHTPVGDTPTLQCGTSPHSSGGEIDKKEKKDKINNSESELSSASVAATQQNKTTLMKLSPLINIPELYKVDKFLSKVNVSASNALEFLEKHKEYTWEEWFINDLDTALDENEKYEDFFKNGYRKYCMEYTAEVLQSA